MSHFVVARRRRSALAAISLATLLALLTPATASAARVFIDPGHGGRYNHARANGVYEKTANLLIALELRNQLQAAGHTVGMSRTGDTSVELRDVPTWNWSDSTGWHFQPDGERYGDPPKDDLQGRVNKANEFGADLFISIHNNGGPTSARGTETYAWEEDVLGRQLAAKVQSAVVAAVGTRNRGAMDTGFYVIRWSNAPSILVECAFVSNPYDAALLKSAFYRARFAKGIANGVAAFLKTNPFKPLYPRVAGRDRFSLSAAASTSTWPGGAGTVLLANADAWPDAVAAAPLARRLNAPILLTAAGSLPASTSAEIARLKPTKLMVLGGTASISETVALDAARAANVAPTALTRLAGRDRYETAAQIARQIGPSRDGTVTVASGLCFSDALSVASYAARVGSPVVLSHGATMTAPTRTFLSDSKRAGARSLLLIGETQALPSAEVAGFTNVRRVYGADVYRTNVAVLNAYHRTGTVTPVVASTTSVSDALVAAGLAAKTGRPLVLIRGNSMSAYTREWIVRNVSRIRNPTFVGGIQTVPTSMEWAWLKSRGGN